MKIPFSTLSLLLAVGVNAGPISNSSSASCWTTLSYDNFDGSAGTFTGLTTAPSKEMLISLETNNNRIFSGTGSMQIRHDVDDVQQTFQNLSGQTDVRVSFSYLPTSYGNAEGFGFKLCVNGDYYSSCTPNETFVVGNNFENGFVYDVEETFDISDISSDPTSVALVFFNSANEVADKVHIDNVKLETKGFCSSIKSTKGPSNKATGCSLRSSKSAPSSQSSGSMLITFDDFSPAEGFGNWIGGGGRATYFLDQAAIRFRGGAGEQKQLITHFDEQDISMFSAVDVNLMFGFENLDIPDLLRLQYSLDGGAFETATSFQLAGSGGTTVTDDSRSFSITDGVPCARTIKLRISSSADSSNEYLYLKAVLVTGKL